MDQHSLRNNHQYQLFRARVKDMKPLLVYMTKMMIIGVVEGKVPKTPTKTAKNVVNQIKISKINLQR